MPIYCKEEGCAGRKKQAHYGIKGSGKKEWCSGCAWEQDRLTQIHIQMTLRT